MSCFGKMVGHMHQLLPKSHYCLFLEYIVCCGGQEILKGSLEAF